MVLLVIEPILLFHKQVKCTRQEVQICMVIILTTRLCVLSLDGEIIFPAFTPDRSTIKKNRLQSTSGGHLHTLGLRANYLDA